MIGDVARQGEPHLVHRGVHVLGVGGGHRLDTNRVLAPHCHVTNHDGARFPANRLVDRVGILLARHCARMAYVKTIGRWSSDDVSDQLWS